MPAPSSAARQSTFEAGRLQRHRHVDLDRRRRAPAAAADGSARAVPAVCCEGNFRHGGRQILRLRRRAGALQVGGRGAHDHVGAGQRPRDQIQIDAVLEQQEAHVDGFDAVAAERGRPRCPASRFGCSARHARDARRQQMGGEHGGRQDVQRALQLARAGDRGGLGVVDARAGSGARSPGSPRPPSVRRMLRVLRWIRRAPRCASRSPIRRVTAAGESSRARAAAAKPPSSITRWKTRMESNRSSANRYVHGQLPADSLSLRKRAAASADSGAPPTRRRRPAWARLRARSWPPRSSARRRWRSARTLSSFMRPRSRLPTGTGAVKRTRFRP